MKSLKHNEQGFVTMIITILIILSAVIFFTYMRVAQAQH